MSTEISLVYFQIRASGKLKYALFLNLEPHFTFMFGSIGLLFDTAWSVGCSAMFMAKTFFQREKNTLGLQIKNRFVRDIRNRLSIHGVVCI